MKKIIVLAAALGLMAALAVLSAGAKDNWSSFWTALGAKNPDVDNCRPGNLNRQPLPPAVTFSPEDAADWLNLGDYHIESGQITNAFADYAKAIELSPDGPAGYQNLAMTIYLCRRDAMKFYGLTEPQVFEKALTLYRHALRLDPMNFKLAREYAESYYQIEPFHADDALAAWTNVLTIAPTEFEREGVHIHLARVKVTAGRLDEALTHLNAVTNADYALLKRRLEHNIAVRENGMTNAPVTLTKR